MAENTSRWCMAAIAATIGILLVVLSVYTKRNTPQTSAPTLATLSVPKGDSLTPALSGPSVVMNTTKGTFRLRLFNKEAPLTTGNFIDLVNKRFYDGLSFHRYEFGFVIQGGDPAGNNTGGFVDPHTGKLRCIDVEVSPKLSHYRAGIIGMARGAAPNSASSQFYITLAPETFLDKKYAIFGEVVEGLPVVMQLRAGDRINSARIEQN